MGEGEKRAKDVAEAVHVWTLSFDDSSATSRPTAPKGGQEGQKKRENCLFISLLYFLLLNAYVPSFMREWRRCSGEEYFRR